MSVTTIWTAELTPGGKSLWALTTLPWQLPLPWQYGQAATTWTKEW